MNWGKQHGVALVWRAMIKIGEPIDILANGFLINPNISCTTIFRFLVFGIFVAAAASSPGVANFKFTSIVSWVPSAAYDG